MKLKTKEIVLLISMIFIISGAIYYYYFLTPKLAELATLSLAKTQKEQQIQQLNMKIDSIPDKKAEIQNLQAQLNTTEEELPRGISNELQLVTISQTLRDYVQSPGYSFESGSNSKNQYQVNLMEANFTTTYEDLLVVLENLSELYHTNQVVSATISFDGDSSNYYVLPPEAEEPDYTDLSVSMILEFFTYYRNEPAQPMEQQSFETSYVEEKSPFSPVPR